MIRVCLPLERKRQEGDATGQDQEKVTGRDGLPLPPLCESKKQRKNNGEGERRYGMKKKRSNSGMSQTYMKGSKLLFGFNKFMESTDRCEPRNLQTEYENCSGKEATDG